MMFFMIPIKSVFLPSVLFSNKFVMVEWEVDSLKVMQAPVSFVVCCSHGSHNNS